MAFFTSSCVLTTNEPPESIFDALRLGHDLQSPVYSSDANVGWIDPMVHRPSFDQFEPTPQPPNPFQLDSPFPQQPHYILPGALPCTRYAERYQHSEWDHGLATSSICLWIVRDVTLALEGTPITESEVVSKLICTPSICSFTLYELIAYSLEISNRGRQRLTRPPERLFKTVTKSLFRRLEIPLNYGGDLFSVQPTLLPQLTNLTIGVQSYLDAAQAFVDMVKSRWERLDDDLTAYKVERLKTAVLHVMNGAVEGTIYQPLKRLDKNGILMVMVIGDGKSVL
ncbi:hypothetical protein PM082_011247 [Marasmius tenuissimus]|nr:hypothetical protein PM082_011247 [Marasmius tenuissimus]